MPNKVSTGSIPANLQQSQAVKLAGRVKVVFDLRGG
jgi:hypothetical protein